MHCVYRGAGADWSNSGLTLGPYSARVVVDLLLGRAAGFDLAPFGIDRFSRVATPLPRADAGAPARSI